MDVLSSSGRRPDNVVAWVFCLYLRKIKKANNRFFYRLFTVKPYWVTKLVFPSSAGQWECWSFIQRRKQLRLDGEGIPHERVLAHSLPSLFKRYLNVIWRLFRFREDACGLSTVCGRRIQSFGSSVSVNIPFVPHLRPQRQKPWHRFLPCVHELPTELNPSGFFHGC